MKACENFVDLFWRSSELRAYRAGTVLYPTGDTVFLCKTADARAETHALNYADKIVSACEHVVTELVFQFCDDRLYVNIEIGLQWF